MKRAIIFTLLLPVALQAEVRIFGDVDMLGTGTYPVDPTTIVATQGLVEGAGAYMPAIGHSWGFVPEDDDFPGTDQIYTGSVQLGYHDGYSIAEERISGPQEFVLDASDLLCAEGHVTSLTLGIAADDFQQPSFGQPFSVLINGVFHHQLSYWMNTIDQTGPCVGLYCLGLDPLLLGSDGIMAVTIDQGGDGGDGWAVDYLTLGVVCGDEVGARERLVDFQLSQNVPNPFNPVTSISFTLAETGAASLKVFDLAGREVATLVNGVLERGAHSVEFDGANLASGVYVYTLQAGATVESRKMVLMK